MYKTNDFILRYANCWEDADLLCSQLNQQNAKIICSIASGGENSFSMLTCNPEKIYVIDINPLQIYLVELKKVAIQQLDYESCLKFKGYKSTENRIDVYQSLKPFLTNDAAKFWDKNINYISNGIIHCGHIEKKMQFFAKYIRPLFHKDMDVKCLMEKKSIEDQILFYDKVWDNFKWRSIFKLFFSRLVMKLMAPDPDFLNYYKGKISDNLLKKSKNHLSSTLAQQNHILHYILFGNYGNLLPHYLQPEFYDIIKNSLHKLELRVGFVQEIGKDCKIVDFYNLSNIFEYTTKEEFQILSNDLYQMSSKDARFMYWNIMVKRKLSEIDPTHFSNIIDSSIDSIPDKGWLYDRCIVDQLNHNFK